LQSLCGSPAVNASFRRVGKPLVVLPGKLSLKKRDSLTPPRRDGWTPPPRVTMTPPLARADSEVGRSQS